MSNKKVAWLSAFRNVVPADYEEWLEYLALQGWNVKKIGQWSSIYMTFNRSQPKRYRFVYDMQPAPKRDYISTYEQFGWEFVGQMASAYIWRKEYEQDRPESFSDAESKKNRSVRVMLAASVSLILFSILAVILTVCFIVNFKFLVPADMLQFILGGILSYSFVAYMGYVMHKINTNKLR